ncbi:ABC transporter ATP-binding protein [Phosphitispora sp. TUW77]|uniref:ABC transporter ATP-binding protein n=1 Tax=Phosphitispora sp. TUW77 TaxID=3152361 RepID=UPI003AB10FB6
MIKICNLTKTYGEIAAVRKVSLSVPQFSAMAILGPSGCGKTTLLRLLSGLEIPEAGEIYIDGRMVSCSKWADAPASRNIGFVFQSPALWPHLTVAGNILFGLRGLTKAKAKERLEELLEVMNIKELKKRYPHEISGGQARRVAIARTLAPKPQRILMDEPLVNLEPELKTEIIAYIKEGISSTGATLVYVTHDKSEASQITKSPLFMSNGMIAGEGESDGEDSVK